MQQQSKAHLQLQPQHLGSEQLHGRRPCPIQFGLQGFAGLAIEKDASAGDQQSVFCRPHLSRSVEAVFSRKVVWLVDLARARSLGGTPPHPCQLTPNVVVCVSCCKYYIFSELFCNSGDMTVWNIYSILLLTQNWLAMQADLARDSLLAWIFQGLVSSENG